MSHNGGLLQGVDQTRLLAILMSVSLEHVLGILFSTLGRHVPVTGLCVGQSIENHKDKQM